MTWAIYDGGASIGQTGSEGGVILRDDEHSDGARITLEKCGHPPFAVTCGLYGAMVHTAFAGSDDEAQKLYDAMRGGLDELMAIWPADGAPPDDTAGFYAAISRFAGRY